MLDELFKRFDGAYVENTLRAYRSDMNDFMQCCHRTTFSLTTSPVKRWRNTLSISANRAQQPPYADA